MIYEYMYKQKHNGIMCYTFKDTSGKSCTFTSSQIKQLSKTHKFNGIAISSKDGRLYFPKSIKKDLTIQNKPKSGLSITTGKNLENFANFYGALKKRDIVDKIGNYLFNSLIPSKTICIIHGLRRTGKTTSIIQSIKILLDYGISSNNICYIVPSLESSKLTDMNELISTLNKLDQTYIFIDEITFVHNFIEQANYITDIFMPTHSDKRLVITGTDSFTFSVAFKTTLLGRAYIINSTWLKYEEYIRIMGRKGLVESDDAIFKSGILYTEAYNNLENSTKELNSAVFENVKNTLFRNRVYKSSIPQSLIDIDNDLLVYLSYSIILKSVEDKSKSTLNRNMPTLNKELEARLKEYSGLISFNPSLRNVKLKVLYDILSVLIELNVSYRISNLVNSNSERHIKAITDTELICMIQSLFYSVKSRKEITDKDKGDLFENFIISQVIMYNQETNKFNQLGYGKYQYNSIEHEIDLLLISHTSNSYAIEIKYSKDTSPEFKRHLIDTSLPLAIERKLIKYIIYRGKTIMGKEVSYINANDFLLNLDKWL